MTIRQYRTATLEEDLRQELSEEELARAKLDEARLFLEGKHPLPQGKWRLSTPYMTSRQDYNHDRSQRS